MHRYIKTDKLKEGDKTDFKIIQSKLNVLIIYDKNINKMQFKQVFLLKDWSAIMIYW